MYLCGNRVSCGVPPRCSRQSTYPSRVSVLLQSHPPSTSSMCWSYRWQRPEPPLLPLFVSYPDFALRLRGQPSPGPNMSGVRLSRPSGRIVKRSQDRRSTAQQEARRSSPCRASRRLGRKALTDATARTYWDGKPWFGSWCAYL